MRSVISRRPILALAVLSISCDSVPTVLPQKAADDSRFELRQDSHGRVVRLDKVTGELSVVDGTRIVPIRPTQRSDSTATKQSDPAPARRIVPSRPVRADRRPAIAGESSDRPKAAAARATVGAGQRARAVGPTPVFGAPGGADAPVSVLDSGAVVTVLTGDVEWCRIEFDGDTGRHAGYVRTSNLAPPVETYRMEPIDLSIRDLRRPSPLTPTDLSVPLRK